MAAEIVKLNAGPKYESKEDFVFDHLLELVATQQILIMRIGELTQEVESVKQILAESKKLYICK